MRVRAGAFAFGNDPGVVCFAARDSAGRCRRRDTVNIASFQNAARLRAWVVGVAAQNVEDEASVEFVERPFGGARS